MKFALLIPFAERRTCSILLKMFSENFPAMVSRILALISSCEFGFIPGPNPVRTRESRATETTAKSGHFARLKPTLGAFDLSVRQICCLCPNQAFLPELCSCTCIVFEQTQTEGGGKFQNVIVVY